MKKYNWVAQDEDGQIIIAESKPSILHGGNYWSFNPCRIREMVQAPGMTVHNWKESLIDLSKNDYIIKDGILMATRKHAALIHAWADGAVIQYKFVGEWETCADDEVPEFCAKDIELRIKPEIKTVKFRNYISRLDHTVKATCDGVPSDLYEWIDKDWQEVEIEI